MSPRSDGREPDDLRPLTFQRDFTEFAAGSVLVSMGKTRVLCTASVDERVPPWMRGRGVGWVTAEYSEDGRAEVDMNVVMTGSGRFVEVQGTAEGQPFSKGELDDLLGLAEHGIAQILDAQAAALAQPPPRRRRPS